jgi:hypothetical protein
LGTIFNSHYSFVKNNHAQVSFEQALYYIDGESQECPEKKIILTPEEEPSHSLP